MRTFFFAITLLGGCTQWEDNDGDCYPVKALEPRAGSGDCDDNDPEVSGYCGPLSPSELGAYSSFVLECEGSELIPPPDTDGE